MSSLTDKFLNFSEPQFFVVVFLIYKMELPLLDIATSQSVHEG